MFCFIHKRLYYIVAQKGNFPSKKIKKYKVWLIDKKNMRIYNIIIKYVSLRRDR